MEKKEKCLRTVKSSVQNRKRKTKKRKNKREKIETRGYSQSMPLHQALDKGLAHTEVMMEEDVNGPESLKAKPKAKKWKAQARINNQRVFSKHGSLLAKRLASEEKWPSPEAKKKKMDSSMEMAVGNLESSTVETGDQPR